MEFKVLGYAKDSYSKADDPDIKPNLLRYSIIINLVQCMRSVQDMTPYWSDPKFMLYIS